MKREIFAATVAVMALCSCKEKKVEAQAEVLVEVAKEVVEETLPEKKEEVFLYGRPETLTERKEYKTEAEGIFLKTFVNDDNVNLRSASGVNGKKVGKATSESGDEARISVFGLTDNDWAKVQSGDVIGFVPQKVCDANREGVVFRTPDYRVAASLTANFGI